MSKQTWYRFYPSPLPGEEETRFYPLPLEPCAPQDCYVRLDAHELQTGMVLTYGSDFITAERAVLVAFPADDREGNFIWCRVDPDGYEVRTPVPAAGYNYSAVAKRLAPYFGPLPLDRQPSIETLTYEFQKMREAADG